MPQALSQILLRKAGGRSVTPDVARNNTRHVSHSGPVERQLPPPRKDSLDIARCRAHTRGMENELRVARAKRRITQVKLALAIGLHPNRYWRIEHDEVDPTLQEARAIAQALDLPVEELFPGRQREEVAS